jgi:lysophospholipase L1-like esterase
VQTSQYPSKGSQVFFAGSNNYYYFYDTAYSNALYQPIPYQDFIIQQDRKGSDARLKVIYDAYSFTGANKIEINSKTKLLVKNKAYKYIKDRQNNDLLSGLGTASSNGKWYVGQNGKGVYRIDLTSLDVKYIRTGLYTANGYNPRVKMAISDDGNTVAYYSGLRNLLEIIDTNSCKDNNAIDGSRAECRYKSIIGTVMGAFDNKVAEPDIDRIEFVNNNTIGMFVYTYWNKQTSDYTAQRLYVSTDDPANAGGLDYLALGDSYASGEGAFSYKNGSDEPWNKCHLSAKSYPFILHSMKFLGATQSVACSGARMKDVVNINNIEYRDDRPQSKKYLLKDEKLLVLNNFFTGSIRQNEFIEEYQPKKITLSISGNDIGFGKIVSKCITSKEDCYNSYQERSQMVSIINAQYGNLVKTLKEIKKYAPTDSRIYLLGYPKVTVTGGQCAKNMPLSNNERSFANDLVEYFNQVINMAAKHSGVLYVDVENAFSGHKLCETESHKVAVNGLTAGNDSPISNIGPLGQESFHPNQLGHELYAFKIAELTQNLTATMPNQEPGNPYLIAESSIKLLSDYSKQPPTANNFYYEPNLIEDVVYKDKNASLMLSGQKYNIKPDSKVNITIRSTPTNLGDYPVDPNGDFNKTLQLPSTVEPGYHTVHISGTNIFDSTFDIQKIVYVAETQNNIDGDQIPNDKELCLAVEPANIDTDGDEIDDACDNFIDQPKSTQQENPAPNTPPNPPPAPATAEYNKEPPLNESLPDWLRAIEKELQSRIITPIVNATSQNVPLNIALTSDVSTNNARLTEPKENSTKTQEPIQPASTATAVQGVTSSAVQSAPKNKANSSSVNNWLIILISVGIFLVIYRVVVILKARK